MTDEDTTDDETEQALAFATMMDFAAERVEKEIGEFDGDVPQHAPSLLVADIGALHGTMMNIQMAESAEDMETPEDEQIAQALSEDAVDILFALAALRFEYDLDIEAAFEERMESIRNHEELEAAIDGSESQDQMMEAMKEHLGDEQMEEIMGGAMTPPPEPGDDVSDDDYDPEEPNRHVQ